MRKFKVGDIAVCVSNTNGENFLTIGESYEVLRIAYEDEIVVFNDKSWESMYSEKDFAHFVINEAPPIGLRPQCIVRVLRLQEIHEAIGRYLEAGKQIPQEWLDEFSILNSEM